MVLLLLKGKERGSIFWLLKDLTLGPHRTRFQCELSIEGPTQ